MSLNGKYTPLLLNVVSGFLQEVGLNINAEARSLQGVYDPEANPEYIPGTLITETVLNKLTAALPIAHGSVSASTFIALSTIGFNSIPALGNSRSNLFYRTYAGKSDPYPPKNYVGQSSSYRWLDGWTRENPYEYREIASESNEYFKYGFIGCVAKQAYHEIFKNSDNQYLSFSKTWPRHLGWMNVTNNVIGSMYNNPTFLLGNFSNINDLTSADLTGVTTSFKEFGKDLINLGKFLNFTNIHKFGLPSVLLRVLRNNSAITEALSFALLYYLNNEEVNNILNDFYTPSVDQERKIYLAFEIISGLDLDNIKIIMNSVNESVKTLADYLNPKLMFPSSYMTLTVPQYSTTTISSKIYQLIYNNGGVNTNIRGLSNYLEGILETDIAIACVAFSVAIQQIKKITSINPEKFAQVVYNMEITNKNLSLINTNSGVPGNVNYSNTAFNKISYGSGPAGTYRICDFFGAAAGLPYIDQYKLIKSLINQLTTNNLRNIYNSIFNNATNESALLSLISQANTEINSILTNNSELAENLNFYWNNINRQLAIEHRAIPFSVNEPIDYFEELNRTDIYAFIQSVESYAQHTEYCGLAQVLENLCDLETVSGQSLVAAMREARNAARLGIAGTELDNDVPENPGGNFNNTLYGSGGNAAPATAELDITSVPPKVIISFTGNGYDICDPPVVASLNPTSQNQVTFTPILDENTGSIKKIEINNIENVNEYSNVPSQLYVAPPIQPIKLGGAIVAGSQSGSPYTEIVPNNLLTNANSSYNTSESISIINNSSQN